VLIVLKSGSLNLLEPSGPVKTCNGIALPLPYPPPSLCRTDTGSNESEGQRQYKYVCHKYADVFSFLNKSLFYKFLFHFASQKVPLQTGRS
jgi:hypothetical protein